MDRLTSTGGSEQLARYQGDSGPGAQPLAVWTVTLSDFETQDDFASWQLLNEGAATVPVLTPSLEHVTSGRHSACLDVEGGGGTFPMVMLAGKDLPEQDWMPYDYLVFDAFNPLGYPLPLDLLATNEGVRDDAVAWPQGTDAPLWDSSRQIVIQPGKQTLRVRVGDVARSTRVTVFRLGFIDPLQSYTLYLDNLRLQTAPVSETVAGLQMRLSETADHMQALGHAEALKPELETLKSRVLELAECGTDLTPEKRSLLDYVLWRGRSSAVGSDLDDLQQRVPIASFNGQVEPYDWGYGWTDGATKVFRSEVRFDGQIGGTLQVELAANEGQGVQIVLRARDAAKTNVRVSVSDLTAEGGGVIPAAQIDILPVGYVNTKKPYYPVRHVGWNPDPLLDFLTTFTLDPEVWQPVWLDIHTRPDQEPGVYRGQITVTADGARTLVIPLEATVWNFAVPHDRHFRTAIALTDWVLLHPYAARMSQGETDKYTAYCRGEKDLEDLGAGEALRLVEIREKFRLMLLNHRLAPDAMYESRCPRVDELKQLVAAGASRFNICNVNLDWGMGAAYWDDETNGKVSESGRQALYGVLDGCLPILEREGLLGMAEVYGWDECVQSRLGGMADHLRELRQRHPDLRISTTGLDDSYGADTGMDDLVDTWIPLLPKYELNPGRIAEAKARGKEVWWYICLNPKRPWPNWFIEYPSAEHRLLMGFMPFKYGVDGFLYYAAYLGETTSCSTDERGLRSRKRAAFAADQYMTSGPLTDFDGSTMGVYSGDGQLMYPGVDGPVPTIRLKNIRDGLQDYEYLWMLKQALDETRSGPKSMPSEWQDRAAAALQVSSTAVRSLTEFTDKGAVVLAVRRDIAELLEQAKASSEES